jgi:hypothetical protein
MGTTVIAIIILVVLNIVSMLIFFLMLKARFSRNTLLGELRSEVDRLVMDLGREADRDVAILESRIQNLRALMDEADRRILVAGKETARRKEESDILQNIALATGPVTTNKAPVEATKTPVEAKKPAAESQWVEPKAQSTVSEPVRIYTRPVITRSDNQIEPFVPVQDRVLDMARRGFTAELISGTLSMPLGEVELILDMNRSSL